MGTEEEFHIAGGATDTVEALANVRTVSQAVLVCKRGAGGATVFEGPIPASLDEGVRRRAVRGRGIQRPGSRRRLHGGTAEGLAFRRGLGPDPAHRQCLRARWRLSRHGCTPAYPSAVELRDFLENGPSTPAVRHDTRLEQIHWATNRSRAWPSMHVFAFDHRSQLEDLARDNGAGADRIGVFKRLCLEAALRVAGGRHGYGILCDGRLGRDVLYAAAGTGLWIGRPVERPGSRPLRLEIGDDFGSALAEWPAEHVVKALCFYRPDDPAELRAGQEATVKRLAEAARANGLDFLLEIIPSKFGPVDDSTTAAVIERFYAIGVFPDWWKLEPMVSDAAWRRACARHREQRSALPGHRGSWAWTRPSKTCGRASRPRPGMRW